MSPQKNVFRFLMITIIILIVLFDTAKPLDIAPDHHDDNGNREYSCPLKRESMFDSLAIFIIDAMRTDFVPTILKPNHSPKWSFLETLAKTNGLGVEILAEPPTVTVPRTKAILTGFNPSFKDVMWNLNSDRIREDNFVKQLYKSKHYHRLFFYGDHTWENFYPRSEHYFDNQMLTSSVNLYDLNGDDRLIANGIRTDLKNDKNWDVLIAHMPGIDRIGHTVGVNMKMIDNKIQFYDNIAKDIIEYWDRKNRTGLFVLTSDHGMTESGGHGSGMYLEISTPFLILTNRPITQVFPVNRSYEQIDIAVTLSELLNINIPNQSEGKLMTNVLQTLGMNSHEVLCSQLRNIEALHRSLNYEQDLQHDTFYETNFQPQLLEARRLHRQYLKDSSESRGQEAIDAYNRYLENIQLNYGRRERYNLLAQLLIIVGFTVLFAAALTFLYFDFGNYSILFSRKDTELNEFQNKKYDNIAHVTTTLLIEKEDGKNSKGNTQNLNNNWFESRTIKLLATIPFVVRFASLGSMRFLEREDIFWDYSGIFFIILILVFNVFNLLNRNNIQKLSIIYTAIMFLLYNYFMVNYKDNIPLDFWKNSIEKFLSQQNKSFISFNAFDTYVFIILLSYLVIQMRTHFKRSGLLRRIFIFWYICIFLYRYKNQNISKIFDIKLVPFRANFYAQMLYLSLICLTIIVIKPNILKICGNAIKNFNCTKLAYLQQSWIVLSATVLEPKFVPLFVGNIVLEELFNQIYLMNSCKNNSGRLNEFVRFLTYLSFAYTAYYQFGNSNSISTLNVTACFTGFDEFIAVPCISLTIISIYSGFIFWLTSLLYRLNSDFKNIDISPKNSVGNSNTNDHHEHHKIGNNWKSYERRQHRLMFYSLVRLGSAWALGALGMATVVTYVLLDHIAIWTIILPKYLYELSFTIVLILAWTSIWISFKCFQIFSIF